MNKTSLMITVLFVLALMGAYSVYQPFLLSITVAILLTMATFNLSDKLIDITHSAKISSSISTLLLSLLLFAPIVYLATAGVGYLSKIDSVGIRDTITTAKTFIEQVPFFKKLSDQYLTDPQITEYIKESTHYITAIGGAGLGFMKNMFLVVVFYFFINFYGDKFFNLLLVILPVNRAKGTRMIQEVSATMEVVFYSVIVTAIFEGVLFGVVMYYFNFNGLLFGVIYGFSSLIPLVGGVAVWAPVSLYIWTKGDSHAAMVIAIYSMVVISIIADTFIKPIIINFIKEDFLKSTIKISSVVIFFSILAGMSTHGFWGMILGPAVTAFLIAITKVYFEYNEKL